MHFFVYLTRNFKTSFWINYIPEVTRSENRSIKKVLHLTAIFMHLYLYIYL